MQVTVTCTICNEDFDGEAFEDVEEDLQEHLDDHLENGYIEDCAICGESVDVTHPKTRVGPGRKPVHESCLEDLEETHE